MEEYGMQESAIDVQKLRNELRSQRSQMFADLSENPANTLLAREIKLLDDRISDLQMALWNKNEKLAAK